MLYSVDVLIEENCSVIVTVCDGADVHLDLLHVREGVHRNLGVIVETRQRYQYSVAHLEKY